MSTEISLLIWGSFMLAITALAAECDLRASATQIRGFAGSGHREEKGHEPGGLMIAIPKVVIPNATPRSAVKRFISNLRPGPWYIVGLMPIGVYVSPLPFWHPTSFLVVYLFLSLVYSLVRWLRSVRVGARQFDPELLSRIQEYNADAEWAVDLGYDPNNPDSVQLREELLDRQKTLTRELVLELERVKSSAV